MIKGDSLCRQCMIIGTILSVDKGGILLKYWKANHLTLVQSNSLLLHILSSWVYFRLLSCCSLFLSVRNEGFWTVGLINMMAVEAFK